MTRRDDPNRRAGFTLVEMLVVIAIISILAALTAAAVMKYITVGQSMSTEVTIRKLTSKLQQHWSEIVSSARKENMDNMFTVQVANPYATGTTVSLNAMTPIRKISNYDEDRARVIYTKLRLMMEFPMTFTEATAPNFTDNTVSPPVVYPLPVKQSYVAKIPQLVRGTPYESSSCLLAALQEARKGINLSADDLGAASVKVIDFTDAHGNTVPCRYLADGWGTPLAFFRYPTGCMELDAMCPGDTGNVVRDVLDTDGKLLDSGWRTSAGSPPLVPSGASCVAAFEANVHSIHNGVSSPYAYYNVPVIASAGPNLQLGLLSPTMSPDGSNADTDNIYSFRLIRPGAGSQGSR